MMKLLYFVVFASLFMSCSTLDKNKNINTQSEQVHKVWQDRFYQVQP